MPPPNCVVSWEDGKTEIDFLYQSFMIKIIGHKETKKQRLRFNIFLHLANADARR